MVCRLLLVQLDKLRWSRPMRRLLPLKITDRFKVAFCSATRILLSSRSSIGNTRADSTRTLRNHPTEYGTSRPQPLRSKVIAFIPSRIVGIRLFGLCESCGLDEHPILVLPEDRQYDGRSCTKEDGVNSTGERCAAGHDSVQCLVT